MQNENINTGTEKFDLNKSAMKLFLHTVGLFASLVAVFALGVILVLKNVSMTTIRVYLGFGLAYFIYGAFKCKNLVNQANLIKTMVDKNE